MRPSTYLWRPGLRKQNAEIYFCMPSISVWSPLLCDLGKTLFIWGLGGGFGERSGGQVTSFQRVPKPTFLFLCPTERICPPSSCPFFFPPLWLCPGLTWKEHGQKTASPAPDLCTGAKLALGKFWGLCSPLEEPMVKKDT